MMSQIPRKIHQIYTKGADKLPDEIRASIIDLRALNPDWEYCFYDNNHIVDYLEKNYEPEMLQLYLKINPQYGAARADFFRYLLMYKEGGVYLDIKSSCSLPLNDIIPEHCEMMVCNWDNRPGGSDNEMGKHPALCFLKNGEYQQWNIIAAPGSLYLNAVINEVVWRLKNYKPWRYGVGMQGVLHTTGPIPFSLGIEKITKCSGFHQKENHRSVGLIYRNVNSKVMKLISKDHYSRLREPVVIQQGMDKFYYFLWLYCVFPFWRLRKNTVNETRKVFKKLKSWAA
jgi:mannosyltransferase OCH1-like enzyme